MLDIEDDHDQEHECCFEDVKIEFVTEKNSVLTASVLYDTKNASDDDQEAGQVEYQKIPCPWHK